MVRKYLQYIHSTKDESRIHDEFIQGNNRKTLFKKSQKILQSQIEEWRRISTRKSV